MKRSYPLRLAALAATLALGAPAPAAHAVALHAAPGQTPPTVAAPPAYDGRILVRIAAGEAGALRAESTRGLARMRAVSPVLRGLAATHNVRSAAPAVLDDVLFPEARAAGLDRWFVLEVDPTAGYAATAARLRSLFGVEYVEPGMAPLELTVVPNDSLFVKNWGHGNTGQLPSFVPGPLIGGIPSGSFTGPNVGTAGFDANVQGGWGAPAGFGSASTIIAILDTGVDPTHPDLLQVAGYDYFDLDADPSDTHGHGTACAGVAAGRANNTRGDAGAAGGCAIMPLRTTSSTSYFPDRLAAALGFAVTNGADVASMSFSVGWTKIVSDALTAAEAAGVTLLAATGNGNQSAISFPASHPKVIAVGAASPCNTRKRSSSNVALLPAGTSPDSLSASCDNETFWGSNFGVAVKDDSAAVDLLGPTMLPTTDIQGAGGFTPSGYNDRFNGTSCATPYVAGVAALLEAQHPTWTPAQVRQRLVETALEMNDVQAAAGWDKYTGYGMVNAGLPEMIPYTPPGWASSVVPRPTADATVGSVPAPTSLNGDVNSFVAMAVANIGEANSGLDAWSVEVDGVVVGTVGYAIPPFTAAYTLTTPVNVRGGRHVLGTYVDHDTTVVESNETNNREAHQWSFNPASVPTSANTVVSRLAPPNRLGGRAQVPVSETTYDNVDAVRMVGPALFSSLEFWLMSLHASDATSDIDLGLHLPPTSATGGFTPGTQLIGSNQPAGKTEWAIVHLGNFTEDDFDATSLGVSGTGQSRFESRLSGAPNNFTGANINIAGTAFTSGMMVALHDLQVSGGGPGPVTLELTSTGPLHMAIHDPALTINNRAGALQFSAQSFGVERLSRTLAAGRHAVVVYRDPTEGTGPLTYSITVRRTPAEMVSTIIPPGGYSPSGAFKAGVGSATAPPTVLDGNANTTHYFYYFGNSGPSPAVGYWTRENIDGEPILTWQPGTFNPGVFGLATTTLRTVRGGRHTMGVEHDVTGAIAEIDETNNDHAIQFVWSPLPLALEVPVGRATPPDPTGGWSDIPVGVLRYSNVDGLRTPFLQNIGDNAYWNFFASAPRVGAHDLDLGAWDPVSSGPTNGFAMGQEFSGLPAGRTDFVGIDVEAAFRAVDLGLINDTGTGNVVVHSAYSRYTGGDVGSYGPYTLGPDSLIFALELATTPGNARQVRIENLSGNADLELSTFERNDPTRLYNPTQAVAYANLYGDGGDEVLQTTFSTQFPAVVVNKRASGDIGKTATFRIVVGTSTVDAGDEPLPLAVRLAPVLPNPVSAAATIAFDLPRESAVELSAYDVAGRRVATLASGTWQAGRHSVRWAPQAASGARLASGVYLLRLEAGGVESVRRVVVTH